MGPKAKKTAERRSKSILISELRDAARDVASAACCLSSFRLADDLAITEATGRAVDHGAEREALIAKAEELLDTARRLAATDLKLKATWASKLELELEK